MAGTGPRADELVRSDKDGREHRLVVDAVVATLAASCDDAIALDTAPVSLTDLTHLATTITARVRDLETSAVDLALALHPTPAVAGTPQATATAAIARLEPTPRDLYAGPCGWVDADGDGEFVVALRGAQIEGARCAVARRRRHRRWIASRCGMGRDPGEARADAPSADQAVINPPPPATHPSTSTPSDTASATASQSA